MAGSANSAVEEHGLAFSYYFGGVEVASDIPLTGLRPLPRNEGNMPVIRVLAGEGEPPAEEQLHYAWNGRFRMRLGEAGGQWMMRSPWGAYLFDRAVSELRIFGLDEPDGAILKDLLARRLLPRLVKLKGGWAYHAASLARGDKGILIMGPSGAGKSTMSVGLAATGGWDILGDDMALIWSGAGDRIAPAASNVSIWPQSCTGLRLAEEDCKPLLGYEGKRVFQPQRTERLDPVPLTGIFFLDRSDCATPELRRHARADAFTRSLAQVIHFNPSGSARQERIGSVMHLNAMLDRVPAWTLTYPASFEALGAVSDVISTALQDG